MIKHKYKQWISYFLLIVILVSCFSVFDYSSVEAADYTNNGCVRWVKDRVSAKLGITLPATGQNKYGLYGANNYWYTLNYSKGSEPRANSLAIWEFNNGSDGQGGKYGHVAFVESVDGNNVTVTEGGCRGYSYAGNTGVICRTQNKSKMATLGGCSGFLGYVYLVESPPQINHNPECYLDAIGGGTNSISIRGWAFDRDALSSAVEIQVFIGGPSGAGEGYAIKANQSRKDVDQVYSCGEHHGFEAAIPTYKRGQQEVWIYAINIGSGTNVLIGNYKVEISRSPVGDIDAVLGGEGSISVRGWAFDMDQISQPLDVHVYIGGPAGSEMGELHKITADKSRTDVNQVYACGDNHGFDDAIATEKNGTQDVYIYI